MKAFFFLVLFAFSSMYANPSQNSFQEGKGHKFYLSNDRLEFGTNGISYHLNSGPIRLSEIHYDENGYFGVFDFFKPKVIYTATCKNCGYVHINEQPQPCTKCDLSEGLEINDIDILTDD